MRTAHLILAALAAATLAGCSSGDANPKPSPTLSASVSGPTTTAPATLDPKAQADKCIQAIIDQMEASTAGVQSEQRPVACEGLDDGAYAQASFDAVQELNKRGREALQRRSDEEAARDAG